MKGISEWIKKRSGERFRSHESIYEREKELVEEAIGRPRITITIELPEGYEDMRGDFERLKDDPEFVEDVRRLVRDHLDRRRGAEGSG